MFSGGASAARKLWKLAEPHNGPASLASTDTPTPSIRLMWVSVIKGLTDARRLFFTSRDVLRSTPRDMTATGHDSDARGKRVRSGHGGMAKSEAS